jgi:hypothetical protein
LVGRRMKQRLTPAKEVYEVKNVILTHGDLDGVGSAFLLIKAKKISDFVVIFTQPHQLDRINLPPDVQELYVTDIAVNNRDVNMTKNFIKTYDPVIKIWADHHKGWSALKEILDNRFIINEEMPSAARVLLEAFPLLKRDVEAVKVEHDATASDTGKLEQLSPQGWLIYKALKVDVNNLETKIRALYYLLYQNPEDEKFIREKAQEYERIEEMTKQYFEKIEIIDGIAVLRCELPPRVDRLSIFLEMERRSPLGVGVMHGFTEYGEVYSVGTNRNIDLVKIFNLPSGNPRNVILPVDAGWTLEKVLEILKKLK